MIFVDTPPGARARPTHATCGECRVQTRTRACGACHLQFPDGWVDIHTTCIAMTGARTTGKSVYVAVALNQLQRLAHLYGIPCGFYSGVSQQAFKDLYEDVLFRDGRVLRQTPAVVRGGGDLLPPALVLNFGVAGDGRPHALVIRDVPGENLESATLDKDLFLFLRNADSLLFMVDPLSIRSVAAMLGQRGALGADPEHVLEGLTRAIGTGALTDRIRVPLGIVLSKFDAVQALVDVESERWATVMSQAGAAMQRDPSLDSPAFDVEDAELLQLEVRSLMQEMKGVEFLNRVSTAFESTTLFAVSALGNSPVGQRLHDSGIAPFRVLDPLKWALSRSGVIGQIRPRA